MDNDVSAGSTATTSTLGHLALGLTLLAFGIGHTGVIDGKFVEGHVPVAQIHALLKRPDLRGIAVPGMPAGSPGMDYGQPHEAYQVLGLNRAGQDEVLASYPAPKVPRR